MIKTLLFIGILFSGSLTTTVNAQTASKNLASKTVVFNKNVKDPLNTLEKNMLIEVYGESLQKYVLNNPERLRSIKNIIRNTCQFPDILISFTFPLINWIIG